MVLTQIKTDFGLSSFKMSHSSRHLDLKRGDDNEMRHS